MIWATTALVPKGHCGRISPFQSLRLFLHTHQIWAKRTAQVIPNKMPVQTRNFRVLPTEMRIIVSNIDIRDDLKKDLLWGLYYFRFKSVPSHSVKRARNAKVQSYSVRIGRGWSKMVICSHEGDNQLDSWRVCSLKVVWKLFQILSPITNDSPGACRDISIEVVKMSKHKIATAAQASSHQYLSILKRSQERAMVVLAAIEKRMRFITENATKWFKNDW